MEQQKKQPQPQQLVFITTVLMVAMMSTVGVFFFLSYQASQRADFTAAENPSTMMFAIIAGVMAVMSFILPMILTPKKPQRDFSGKKVGNPGQFYVPAVMSFAMSEAVAIMGFLATNETGDFQMFLPFGFGALALLIIHGTRFIGKMRAF
jgi:F0F1-type ATP synthase membrane subunit c/vacuolar-type H+-ATPase subunit K